MPVFLSPSTVSTNPAQRKTNHDLPRFGRGSSSCAGSEKRTEAISATPTNLVPNHVSVWHLVICVAQRRRCGGQGRVAYFRRMERKVFSLEESSGAFSGTAVADMVCVQARIYSERQREREREREREIAVQSNRKGGKLTEVGEGGLVSLGPCIPKPGNQDNNCSKVKNLKVTHPKRR